MLISPFLKEASFCSQQRPLLKTTISQNAKNNWPWDTHPQSIHLQHKLLHLRFREHLRGRKTITATGPERYTCLLRDREAVHRISQLLPKQDLKEKRQDLGRRSCSQLLGRAEIVIRIYYMNKYIFLIEEKRWQGLIDGNTSWHYNRYREVSQHSSPDEEQQTSPETSAERGRIGLL